MATNAMFLLIAALLVAGIVLLVSGLKSGRLRQCCPSCGESTAPGGRFCGHCGASLDRRK